MRKEALRGLLYIEFLFLPVQVGIGEIYVFAV